MPERVLRRQKRSLDHGRFEDVHSGGYDPDQHLKDMRLDGVAGEVLYPSQGLFYFKVADSQLMSAIFRTYNDWLAEFCSTALERLKGIAMINLDDVQEGIQELERSAKQGLVGAMISEYPPEDRRYDRAEYEPFWAAAQALAMPLSLHTATRRQGINSGMAQRTIRDASRRATKAFLPATSLCDMLFSGVFERYPDLKVGVVEFELSWVPYLLNTMDYTYRERHEEATYRFKDGLLPSDLFHRQVFLSFQEDAVGIRLRDIIGVDNIMWGSDYPHSESTFPRSRQVLDEILAQVPQEERAKIVDTMLPGSIASTSSALSPRPADPSGQSSAGARDAATPTSLITETAHASCIRQARSYRHHHPESTGSTQRLGGRL